MIHYYHVAAVNDWERLLDEHFTALLDSGLYDELDVIGIGIVGHPLERAYVRSYLRQWDSVEVVQEQDAGWEQTTLTELWGAAQVGAAGPVLYGHTKGVWNQSRANETWRAAMLRHLVMEWRTATDLLPLVDVVGSHRLDDIWPYETPEVYGGAGGVRRMCFQMWRDSCGEFPFEPETEVSTGMASIVYAGNWWWTTMEWVRSLPPPMLNSRFDAERWIGSTEGHLPRVVITQPGWPLGRVGKSLWKDSGSDQ